MNPQANRVQMLALQYAPVLLFLVLITVFGSLSERFLTPVKFDDELTITLTAKQISPRASAAYGEVRWDAEVVNGAGDPVAKYDVLTLVAKRDA